MERKLNKTLLLGSFKKYKESKETAETLELNNKLSNLFEPIFMEVNNIDLTALCLLAEKLFRYEGLIQDRKVEGVKPLHVQATIDDILAVCYSKNLDMKWFFNWKVVWTNKRKQEKLMKKYNVFPNLKSND